MLRKREGAMRQKYEEKKAKLYIDALNDECLPIVCAVDSFYEFLFDVIKKPEDPEKPEESIHLGIENRMKKHLHGTDLTEFLSLLKAVLDQVLAQSTEVVEERHTHVVYANKSVLRIDYYLYFHTFSDGSIKNTLMYFVQVGVIDIARARLPVLIYELTRATNSNTLRATGNKLEDIAKSSIHLYQAMQILADATRGRGAGGGGKRTRSRRRTRRRRRANLSWSQGSSKATPGYAWWPNQVTVTIARTN